ncbi:MAG: hypothetical protein Q9219_006651 [cf. Caloplaca sp. 3 TL-2023]
MVQRILVFSILWVTAIGAVAPGVNPIYRPQCWEELPNLLPAVFRDCLFAFNLIVEGRDPDEVLSFSNKPYLRPDMVLPHYWKPAGKRCMVGLQYNMEATESIDRTTLFDVKGAALASALQCVIKPPHRGGTVVVGWSGNLIVNVLHLKPPGSHVDGVDGMNGTLSIE